jgi:nucleoside-diphosphate-sugar epimerase
MRIGITGATGFVGSHLIRHFAAKGHQVIAYGRNENPPQLLNKYAHYISWNLDNYVIPQKFKGDVFIHAAGFVDFWGSYKDMYKTNVEGTVNALEVAKNAKHFIYISTASVYDSFTDKYKVAEEIDYPIIHANNYAKTKTEAEKVIIQHQNKFEKVTIVRPHAIYGPGDRTLIPRILSSLTYNKAIVIGSGKNMISITHVGNICYGLSLIINSKIHGLKIYNLTDSEALSINDIYNCLFDIFNMKIQKIYIPYSAVLPLALILENIYKFIKSKTPPLLTVDIARQFTQESTLSLEKIVSDLKYDPPFNYQAGVTDLKIWIDTQGGLANYISNPINSWNGKLFTY